MFLWCLHYPDLPPDLALLTFSGSNYPCLKQIFMVPKVLELLKCDCILVSVGPGHVSLQHHISLYYNSLFYITAPYITSHLFILHLLILHQFLILHLLILQLPILQHISLYYICLYYSSLYYITSPYITYPSITVPCITSPDITSISLHYISLYFSSLYNVTSPYITFPYITHFLSQMTFISNLKFWSLGIWDNEYWLCNYIIFSRYLEFVADMFCIQCSTSAVLSCSVPTLPRESAILVDQEEWWGWGKER